MNALPSGLTNNRGPNRFPEAVPNIRRPERQRRNSNASTIKDNAIEIPNIYNMPKVHRRKSYKKVGKRKTIKRKNSK